MMAETTMEEMERLNPMMKWGLRKCKRVIKKRADRLWVGSYALGCRGHPGVVIERDYDPRWSIQHLFGADIMIKSLIDGVEESCSIFNCAPMAITRREAEERIEFARTHHGLDASIRYGKVSPEVIRRDYWDAWIARGAIYYVLSEQHDRTICSANVMTKEDAQEEIDRLSLDVFVERGISNPRMVDFRSYPVTPKLFSTD